MAEKVERPLKKVPEGQDDLEVLNPERHLTIDGRKIVVREYGFIEGLKLRPIVKPLLDDLFTLLKTDSIDSDAVQLVLAKHADLVVQLIEQAADLEPGFMATLRQTDGDRLMATWWSINGPFFMRSVTDRVINEQLAKRLRAGPTHTSCSSSTDTQDQTSQPTPRDS